MCRWSCWWRCWRGGDDKLAVNVKSEWIMLEREGRFKVSSRTPEPTGIKIESRFYPTIQEAVESLNGAWREKME